MTSLPNSSFSSVHDLWSSMDREWRRFRCNKYIPLRLQQNNISKFYSSDIWVENGLFTFSDPLSRQHRTAIAKFLLKKNIQKFADYGGGCGLMAYMFNEFNPTASIDIIEPYPFPIFVEYSQSYSSINYISSLCSNYNAVVAIDVLEHVDNPLSLVSHLVQHLDKGGYLILANCFYPVIDCHLPKHFYLRHLFPFVISSKSLSYLGTVSVCPHAHIFQKISIISNYQYSRFKYLLALFLGIFLNIYVGISRRIGTFR